MVQGKTALVTGANKGLGYEMARQLAERGYTVWAGSRDRGRGEAAAAKLASAGEVRALELDVGDAEGIRRAAQAVAGVTDHLDVLINNAGIAPPDAGKASTADPQVVKAVFETNVFGVLNVTQAFLPLVRRSPAGRIVMISSGLGSLSRLADPTDSLGTWEQMAYSASKAALNAITIAFANELRDTPIKVNAINPGVVATDINNHRGMPPEQGVRRAIEMATMEDGPTGGFFNDSGVEPW